MVCGRRDFKPHLEACVRSQFTVITAFNPTRGSWNPSSRPPRFRTPLDPFYLTVSGKNWGRDRPTIAMGETSDFSEPRKRRLQAGEPKSCARAAPETDGRRRILIPLDRQPSNRLTDAPNLDYPGFLDPVEIPVVGYQDCLRLKACRGVQNVRGLPFREVRSAACRSFVPDFRNFAHLPG